MSELPERVRPSIPYGVIKRLPLYHRYLTHLKARDIERVSSQELASKAGVKASQLRHDLNMFGSFGQQGYGYRVSDLLAAIESILGLNRQYTMVIVGAGNIGCALARYPSFRRRGFELIAIFDCDREKIGSMVGGVHVRDVYELDSFLQSNHVDIGVIATAPEAVAKIADIMIAGGVKGLWNFAPVRLEVPENISLEHIHLGESLYSLAFRINQNIS